jgi:glycosyltransferase involved in cell wall biosynthesis
MKILLINYEFPPLGGGAATATKSIAKELANLGHEVIIISSSFKNLAKEESIDGYKLIRVKSLRKKMVQSNPLEMITFVISAIFFLNNFLKKWRPGKIIAFFSIPSGIIAYWLYKKYKVPYIISLRGGDVPGSDKLGTYANNLHFYHWLTLPLNKKIWQKASSIIANSKSLQKLAQKTADKINRKVVYIPNGVDGNIFFPGKKIINNKFKVLYIGRISREKNIKMLIRAIKQMPEINNINLECEIVGRGPQEKELLKMVGDLKIDSIIKFSGWLDREETPDKFKEADVFILPSKSEGMPNVVLEAMASGLPVITTDISGNQELIENDKNGILVNDSNQLTEALIKLIKYPELRNRFSQSSLEKSKKYNWEKVAQQYLEICKT